MLNDKYGQKIYVTKNLKYFCSDWSALSDSVTVDGEHYKRLTAELWDSIDNNLEAIINRAATDEQANQIADFYAELLLIICFDVAK